ncbi:glycosyltransferase [Pseudomonas aeruginosa]
MRYYKGLHILLDALQGTDYPVVIVGAGPLQAELYAQAAALGLRNVHFLGRGGRRGQGRPAATRAHAMVFPSHLRSEAFGISLLEGAMYGKPMISQRDRHRLQLHQYPWRDRPGRCRPANRPRFAKRCAATREHPQQAEKWAGTQARYRQLFTAEEMGRRWSELYRELLEEKASSRYVKAAR